jgi:hypothetical protein
MTNAQRRALIRETEDRINAELPRIEGAIGEVEVRKRTAYCLRLLMNYVKLHSTTYANDQAEEAKSIENGR